MPVRKPIEKTRGLSFLLGRRALKSASATQRGSTKVITSRVSWLYPCPFRWPDKESEPKWNPHWRGTTTTVRSLLHPFIDLKPAEGRTDKSTKIIEKLFVHVRTGKCCSNVGGTSQEPDQLYENCGRRYLGEEVGLLKSNVIITQGNTVHDKSEKYVFDAIKKRPVNGISDADSRAYIVRLKEDKRRVYWLKLYFPVWTFLFSEPCWSKN